MRRSVQKVLRTFIIDTLSDPMRIAKLGNSGNYILAVNWVEVTFYLLENDRSSKISDMPRPRSHSKKSLIVSPMYYFWMHGYANSSMNKLVAATGLSRNGLLW